MKTHTAVHYLILLYFEYCILSVEVKLHFLYCNCVSRIPLDNLEFAETTVCFMTRRLLQPPQAPRMLLHKLFQIVILSQVVILSQILIPVCDKTQNLNDSGSGSDTIKKNEVFPGTGIPGNGTSHSELFINCPLIHHLLSQIMTTLFKI